MIADDIYRSAVAGKLYVEPCPYIFTGLVFDAVNYDQMADEFPLLKFTPGRYAQKTLRCCRPLVEGWHSTAGSWDGATRQFWADMFLDDDMGPLGGRLLELFGMQGEGLPKVHFTHDMAGSDGLAPHIESGTSISLVIYMPTPGLLAAEDEGTRLYEPYNQDQDRIQNLVDAEARRKDFRLVATTAYQPNTAIVLPTTRDAWHGIDAIHSRGRRAVAIRWLNNNAG
jgi:hypothetical protein